MGCLNLGPVRLILSDEAFLASKKADLSSGNMARAFRVKNQAQALGLGPGLVQLEPRQSQKGTQMTELRAMGEVKST